MSRHKRGKSLVDFGRTGSTQEHSPPDLIKASKQNPTEDNSPCLSLPRPHAAYSFS